MRTVSPPADLSCTCDGTGLVTDPTGAVVPCECAPYDDPTDYEHCAPREFTRDEELLRDLERSVRGSARRAA